MIVRDWPVSLLLEHCWACGAGTGDYEDFVAVRLKLQLCEPTDRRFDKTQGYQLFCSACVAGRLNIGSVFGTHTRWTLSLVARRSRLLITYEAN